jgi:hypothetical protein
MPQLAMPLRVALLGLPQSPSIDAVLEVLGRERVLANVWPASPPPGSIDKRPLRSDSFPGSSGDCTMSRVLLPLFACRAIHRAACATSPEGRQQLMAPAPNCRVSAPPIPSSTCSCNWSRPRTRQYARRRSASRTGLSTSASLRSDGGWPYVAFRQHADLYLRFPRFEFIVVDKAEPGRGVQCRREPWSSIASVQRISSLDDAVLAFILAREMCHIIAGHHDENVDRQRTGRGGGANTLSGAQRRWAVRQRQPRPPVLPRVRRH